MSTRATQSPDYWGSRFTLSGDDRELLLNLFVEDEQPRSSDELAQALIRHRVEREEAAIRRKQQAQGTLYQPKRAFQVDEQVVFPALDFAVGRVAAVRPGHNPDVPVPFKVIQVDHGRRRRARICRRICRRSPAERRRRACCLPPMSWCRPRKSTPATKTPSFRICATLLHNSPEFVWLAGKWFPRSLLVEINEGQLNIAEAILDMNGGGPLPTEALLPELGLPAEVNRALQIFSLNYALYTDERFDEVGPAGEVLWFLNRLEPAEVINTPAVAEMCAAECPRRQR